MRIKSMPPPIGHARPSITDATDRPSTIAGRLNCQQLEAAPRETIPTILLPNLIRARPQITATEQPSRHVIVTQTSLATTHPIPRVLAHHLQGIAPPLYAHKPWPNG